ncbi:DUF1254 domain-containing protein, partial [Nostoc sp. NIES-2111]
MSIRSETMEAAMIRTVLIAGTLAGLLLPRSVLGAGDDDLAQARVQHRAAEAVVWGMPAVNFDLMFQAMQKVGGKENQIVYWSSFIDWKNQTLTPNPSTIYFMPFVDTATAGPVVIEIPPATGGSITRTVFHAWQGAPGEGGPPRGGKGGGGKDPLPPPGYPRKPPPGLIVPRSPNNMARAPL